MKQIFEFVGKDDKVIFTMVFDLEKADEPIGIRTGFTK